MFSALGELCFYCKWIPRMPLKERAACLEAHRGKRPTSRLLTTTTVDAGKFTEESGVKQQPKLAFQVLRRPCQPLSEQQAISVLPNLGVVPTIGKQNFSWRTKCLATRREEAKPWKMTSQATQARETPRSQTQKAKKIETVIYQGQVQTTRGPVCGTLASLEGLLRITPAPNTS